MSQTPDIVERLREQDGCYRGLVHNPFGLVGLTLEAADTIEALRSEVTDLQNTIARLTRELGEARDAFQRHSGHAFKCLNNSAQTGDLCTCGYSDAIARHEHRKELSND